MISSVNRWDNDMKAYELATSLRGRNPFPTFESLLSGKAMVSTHLFLSTRTDGLYPSVLTL
jgi:hypothetical protein